MIACKTRAGAWRCKRHPELELAHSLAIIHHLGLWIAGPENAPELITVPKGLGCQSTDIYFDCTSHGEEPA